MFCIKLKWRAGGRRGHEKDAANIHRPPADRRHASPSFAARYKNGMLKPILGRAIAELGELLPKLSALEPATQRLAGAMLACWERRGKVLIAGNGGSAADAMHFAEELAVRYQKDRRALAAVALCDASVLTCAGNDFGYDRVFARQVEALGNPGDVFIAMTTSGNSPNILLAIEEAKDRQMTTAAFLGKRGGRAQGLCDVELIVPSDDTARIQEAHKLLFHVICEWIDTKVS
jgi:D-sedoheptulose 7-phosphate isomerase